MSPRVLVMLGLIAVSALSGCGGSKSSSSAQTVTKPARPSVSTPAASTGAIGPEGVVLETGTPLAPASSTTTGATVDGIQCAPLEQLAYHIHAHLQVYVDGQPRQLPPAIGLLGPVSEQTAAGAFYGAETCYYWLHTHAADGIIHIESPTARIYTLGEFFNEWRQPLSATRVGPATGKVTAFVNGARWTKDPTTIPLKEHFVIQLDVGSPVVAFHQVSFGNDGL